MNIKSFGKNLICSVLELQTKKLLLNNPKLIIIGVCGSIGKTSTKICVADLLSTQKRVRYQDGNYNDRLTVPLVIFGHQNPGIYNLMGWLKIFYKNQQLLKRTYPYDVVVVELGVDGPNQMKDFSYLKLGLLIITAIAPEHMENFKSIDKVAAEELYLTSQANKVLINVDDCPKPYLKDITYLSYSLIDKQADYRLDICSTMGVKGSLANLYIPKKTFNNVTILMPGQQGAKISLAGLAVLDMYSLLAKQKNNQPRLLLQQLKPVPGRMQILQGIKDSIIIDDTYNSSPQAAIAALKVLYDTEAKQRVAILGSMNELGAYSKQAHEEVAKFINPKLIDLVVIVGQEAIDYMLPIVKTIGCRSASFVSSLEAGKFVKLNLETKAVILVKGSQNGVFCEEAIKPLLKNQLDRDKLVRQSVYWLKQKNSL